DVVALHFAGEYLKANYAVPMCELARDSRVAPLLNFDGTVPPTNDWAPAWRSVERTEGSGSAPAPSQPSPPASIALQLPSSSTDVAAWTIPLRVSVAIGRPSTAFPQPADTAVDHMLDWDNGVAEEAIVIDPDYSNRSGYDSSFLETVDVPLPRVSKEMEQDTARVRSDAQKNDDPFEL